MISLAKPAMAGTILIYRDGFEPPTCAQDPRFCGSPKLNDTGQTVCFNAGPSIVGNCEAYPEFLFPLEDQDATVGRDAAARTGILSKQGTGWGGFDFSKVSNSGNVISPSVSAGTGPNDWGCTKDHVTGLLWEAKSLDPAHLRYADHTYTWFNPASPDGDPGAEGNLGHLPGSGCSGLTYCNTHQYLAAVNATSLCGRTGWRLPTKAELVGILLLDEANSPGVPAGPGFRKTFEPTFFATAQCHATHNFWTSQVVVSGGGTEWAWQVGESGTSSELRMGGSCVIAVTSDD